jgi:hypothetical protein
LHRDHETKLPAGGRLCQAGYLAPVLRRPLAALSLVLSFTASRAAAAQGLPALEPINPVATSRTGLYFQPLVTPAPGHWQTTLALDYDSIIEFCTAPAADYTLDSEQLRLKLGLTRGVGAGFLLLGAEARGSYAGFLDGFLHWYHGLLGIRIPERDRRPENDFLYSIALPDGTTLRRASSDLFLGDLRLGYGLGYRGKLQSVASVTLPTSTGPEGYGRGVASLGLLNTVRLRPAEPLVYEGSLDLGYSPTHGRLSPWQRKWMVAASSGLRYRFWGRQSLYANLWYHSPYYRNTMVPGLDRKDLSLDFGWILATRGGLEWRIGMTEAMEPNGPAVDIVFRLGSDR